MRKATVLILIAVLAFASVALAGKGDRDKNGAFTKKIITADPNATYTSAHGGAAGIKARTKGALIRKSATGASFNLPEASVYDYGTNSGIRTQVVVSNNGNVHISAFVRPSSSVNDRHVVYWYNPGELTELFTDATGPGEGWTTIQVLADGRAVITFHTDSLSVLVDQLEGFGIFVGKEEPVQPDEGNSIWQAHAIGSDDKIWYATNRWSRFPGDSTRVWTSTDDATTWTEVTTIDKSATHGGGAPEPVVRVSPDGTEALVKMEWAGGSDITIDSVDIAAYYTSTDGGTTWNEVVISFEPYAVSNADPTLIADVFMSDAATADTLIIENFGQVDITYDWEGNVHAIMNGYSFYGWFSDTVTVCDSLGCTLDTLFFNKFAWPQLHYSSVRGELAANFVEVSDPTMTHSDWIDEGVAAGWWAGNNIGIGYPTISAIDNGPGLMVVYCQPQLTAGVPDTIGGFMVNDLWMATSDDGGDTWKAPTQLTNTPLVSELFPTLGKPLLSTGNADEYRYHLVYMEDHVPGTWVFGESDSGLVQWVYMTETVNIVVGIEDENVISAKSFALEQNYPNPFNPSTTIEFTLDKKSDVKLTIFNMLGQEVTTLVDGVMEAGSHFEVWDASDIASGVYFYKLTAGDLTRTKKMVLLK